MTGSSDNSLLHLRKKAEDALARSVKRGEVEPLLERILERAPKGSETSLFAHRHLAELRLEVNPWRAALHVRELLAYDDHDDVLHALMGLSQALLGNYRAAVTSYRRALVEAPHTPWYHHNLGHLLDVAMGDAARAESHLRTAYRMQPEHDEIAASLAHCLARLDLLDEARSLAEQAISLSPDSEEHQSLLRWILDGAPADRTVASGAGRGVSPVQPPAPTSEPKSRAVRRAFEERMREADFSLDQIDGARALWADFHEGRRVRMKKPEVYAAAVEYAIALIHGQRGVTQAGVARRYGVAPGSLSSRYGEIREALDLRPNDPRYEADA